MHLSSKIFSVLLGLFSASCAGVSSAQSLIPADLLKEPTKYLNRRVEVDIVEPLYGPSTPQALANAEYGQLQILVPNSASAEVSLVPTSFRLEDPNRYKQKFDRVLKSPLRVKGEFLSDDDLAKEAKRPRYVIRVSSAEPLPMGSALPVRSLAEIKVDPARWNRKFIVYEGVYENRFEVSAVDREIWLSFRPDVELIGKPDAKPGGSQIHRVRVTGTLFSEPGMRYGHLGGYPFELLASKVEFLGGRPTP
ncbi:MAG: hypothetical protein U1F57_05400 [bacterium]